MTTTLNSSPVKVGRFTFTKLLSGYEPAGL